MAASTVVWLRTDRDCTLPANAGLGEVLIGGFTQHPSDRSLLA